MPHTAYKRRDVFTCHFPYPCPPFHTTHEHSVRMSIKVKRQETIVCTLAQASRQQRTHPFFTFPALKANACLISLSSRERERGGGAEGWGGGRSNGGNSDKNGEKISHATSNLLKNSSSAAEMANRKPYKNQRNTTQKKACVSWVQRTTTSGRCPPGCQPTHPREVFPQSQSLIRTSKKRE